MLKIIKKYLIVFALIWFLPVNGQDISFRNISTLNGLPNGTINSITQDEYGFMWLATWGGLMKYDGYNVEIYYPVPGEPASLPARRVHRLLTDSDGNIWCLTSKGVSRYNKSTDDFSNYSIEGKLARNIPQGLFEMNRILYIQFSGHLYYLPLDHNHGDHFLREVNIEGMASGELGRLINFNVLNNEEVLLRERIPFGVGRIISKIFTANSPDNKIGELKVNEIFELESEVTTLCSDKQGRIFTGTRNGLYVFNKADGQLKEVSGTQDLNISYLFLSSDNKLWIGTSMEGLASLDLKTGEFERYLNDPNKTTSLSSNIIYSMSEDFSGNLWVGHGGEGISILNLTKDPFERHRIDPINKILLNENTVFSFNETEDEMLIGTNFDGLNFMTFDKESQKYILSKASFPEGLTGTAKFPSIWHIAKESPERFLLGTNFGLILTEKRNGQWYFEKFLRLKNSGTIRQIYIDDDRNLWVGSNNGLLFIPRGTRDNMKVFVYRYSENDPNSLSGLIITSFLIDSKDNFWVGTQDGGLNLLKTKYSDLNLSGEVKPDLQFIRFSASKESESSPNTNEITCLYENSDGKIWVGTYGGGVNLLDSEKFIFTSLGTDKVSNTAHIYNILQDQNKFIWIISNEGLSRMDNETGLFSTITPPGGILGNIFLSTSFFKSQTGIFFYAGRNGFNTINPLLASQNSVAPKLSFTKLYLFQKRIKTGEEVYERVVLHEALTELDEITLSYKASEISIHYSVIHYQNPQNNTLEYRMEGYSDNWTKIPASLGYLNFTNLPHGVYNLQLRASNSDNIWNPEPKSLQINILPPWWKTLLARIIAIMIILAFIAGIMALLLHRQSLKYSLKIEKLENQNIKSQNEEKLRFFTNVSHELRTPLSLTLAPIEELLLKPEKLSKGVLNQLNLANRNAKILLRLINQIMDFRKANAGKLKLNASEADMKEFIVDIIGNFESLRKEKKIELHLDLPENNFMLWFDNKKMEQVIYNLISNAYKYTCEKGNVSVSLSKSEAKESPFENKEELAVLTIFNDGAEIPADELEKIFERFYKSDNLITGTGIGLSLVKSLVELHKGAVKASSGNGGVTFTICLPLGESHLSEEEKLISDFPAKQNHVPEYVSSEINIPNEDENDESSLTLLLVEDNGELRSFLKGHFAKNYIVSEAADGEEGLAVAKEIIPDIIISDIMMPGISGYELCEKVKENISTSHIPVLLLTAKDSSENKIQGYDCGADAYVVKPFEISVLDSEINQLIKNRKKIWEAYKQGNFLIKKEDNNIISREDHYINRVREIIDDNIGNSEFNVAELSEKLSISSSHLYRKILAITGYPTNEFIRTIRLINASELLINSHHSVKEICYMTGFNSPSYFIKCFKDHFKMTPNDYSKEMRKKRD